LLGEHRESHSSSHYKGHVDNQKANYKSPKLQLPRIKVNDNEIPKAAKSDTKQYPSSVVKEERNSLEHNEPD
jgi:hypothetical protein